LARENIKRCKKLLRESEDEMADRLIRKPLLGEEQKEVRGSDVSVLLSARPSGDSTPFTTAERIVSRKRLPAPAIGAMVRGVPPLLARADEVIE
jgi:hypothetical protein